MRSVGLPQIRGDCGWNMSNGSASVSSSSSSGPYAHTYWDYTPGSAGDEDFSGVYTGAPGRNAENDGPIRNGRRHPLCGGEYLDRCDLGPYLSSDVGDGSCEQHLNTEECHYDGGKFSCMQNSKSASYAGSWYHIVVGVPLPTYHRYVTRYLLRNDD